MQLQKHKCEESIVKYPFVLHLLCESACNMQELQIQAESSALLRALKCFILLFH